MCSVRLNTLYLWTIKEVIILIEVIANNGKFFFNVAEFNSLFGRLFELFGSVKLTVSREERVEGVIITG